MKTCRFCAEEIQDAAIVCKHCGRDLVAASAVGVVAAPRHGSGRKWIIGLGVLGAFMLWSLFNDPAFQRGFNRGQRGTAGTPGVTMEYLRSVIYSTGEPCPEVTQSFLQGTDGDGTVIWNAKCAQGQSYVVTVKRDGSTRVADCIDMRRLTQVECFKPLK